MIICGKISGFMKEEIEEHGFPIDGIQLCVGADIILEGEPSDIGFNTDVFIDISSAEYIMIGNVLEFKARCESMMLDGNETDIDINGDLAYTIIKNSIPSEIVLSGDYLREDFKENRKNLDKLKVLGSLWFGIGIGSVHRKCNKVKFY